MVELRADAAPVPDLGRPGDRHALPGATEEGRDLLGPLVWRGKRPGPANRIVGIGLVRTPGVVPPHLLVRRQVDAVERQRLVRCAGQRPLCAPTVITADV